MKSSWPTTGKPKTPEWELDEFRRRAWKYDGVACIRVDTITDDWLRQAITNLANEKWGNRNVRSIQRCRQGDPHRQ